MILRAGLALMRRRQLVVGLVIALLGSGANVAAMVQPAASVPGARAQRWLPAEVASTARPELGADGRASVTIPTAGASTATSTAIGSPSGAAAPRPAVSPAHGTFSLDLYRRGDFISQARADWCVPAAIQTMAHLIGGLAGPSLPSQGTLDRRSRALSSSRLVGLGSEPKGWAGVLNGLGYGPYVVVAKRTLADAITTAADAIRLTGRPVGLLVWRGAHAWVMSGFEATGDPAGTGPFHVTGVRVSDPWYPRRMSAWGRSRQPDANIDLAMLAKSFLPWHRPTVRYAELDGRYVLVLPVPAMGDGSWQPRT